MADPIRGTSSQLPKKYFLDTNPNDPKELHYICPVSHLPLILEKGLLSRRRAQSLKLVDVSEEGVQGRRSEISPSNPAREKKGKRNLTLHSYVNLYFQAYNGTLYTFKERLEKKQENICILRIHPKVLKRRFNSEVRHLPPLY